MIDSHWQKPSRRECSAILFVYGDAWPLMSASAEHLVSDLLNLNIKIENQRANLRQ